MVIIINEYSLQRAIYFANFLVSQSSFLKKNDNIDIIANFVFPHICSFLRYLHCMMSSKCKIIYQ